MSFMQKTAQKNPELAFENIDEDYNYFMYYVINVFKASIVFAMNNFDIGFGVGCFFIGITCKKFTVL